MNQRRDRPDNPAGSGARAICAAAAGSFHHSTNRPAGVVPTNRAAALAGGR